jgi:hypothetical protein
MAHLPGDADRLLGHQPLRQRPSMIAGIAIMFAHYALLQSNDTPVESASLG